MSTFPFPPRLDGRVVVYGEYDGSRTTFHLPVVGMAVTHIVLSDDFGADAGRVYVPGAVFPDKVSIEADLSAGAVILGRGFTSYISLTRPFARDQNGVPRVRGYTRIKGLRVSHAATNAYLVRTEHFAPPTRDDRTKTFFGSTPYEPDTAAERNDARRFLQAWNQGRADRCRVHVENDSPWPSTIVSLEWTVDYDTAEGGA